MKRTFFFLLFFAISFFAFGQQETYTFYMKDGTTFVGELIEKTKDGNYRVKTGSGSEVLFNDKQIRRIIIGDENITDFDEYGRKQAMGLSLFGPGLIGLHFRSKLEEEFFLDLGLHFTTTFLYYESREEWEHLGDGATIELTGNYFLERHLKQKPHKQKIRANGLFFNGSHTFGTYDATRFGLGWASEYFKLEQFKNSFLLELGLGLQFNHWLDDPRTVPFSYQASAQEAYVHAKLTWIFHLGNE